MLPTLSGPWQHTQTVKAEQCKAGAPMEALVMEHGVSVSNDDHLGAALEPGLAKTVH